MAFTIFFATSTGKTEDISDRLKELLGTDAKDVDSISGVDDHGTHRGDCMFDNNMAATASMGLAARYGVRPPSELSLIHI